MNIQIKNLLVPAIVAVGIVITGCANESIENSIATSQVGSSEKNEPECCANNENGDLTTSSCCNEPTDIATDGCCGQCQQESKASSKITSCCQEPGKTETDSNADEMCSDCNECASGDSSNCKCESGASLATKNESVSTTHINSQQSKKSQFQTDRDVFHLLLTNHDKITRNVKETENGVVTITESKDPEIAAKIQEHVAAMYQRVEKVQPIRMRDPLYRELFKHTDKIEMKLEKTPHGIKVVETSEDSYVAKLIKEHARTVSKFVKFGFDEARKNHSIPKR